LAAYVAKLPHMDEVFPALDLRGVELPRLIAVRKTDLSGSRFDGAHMNWNFGGSILREAVFDRAEGHNIDFGGCDVTKSSFADARLPGAIFFQAKLSGANLKGIRMRGGQLKGADCQQASFQGADLRMVWAAEADLRGADLRDANLVGASLGKARWDETTQLEGAKLSTEGTPAELCVQALEQGGIVESEKDEWNRSLFQATQKVLQTEAKGRSTAALSLMSKLAPEIEKESGVLWANKLHEKLSKEQWQEVQQAVRTAASNLGTFLE
jgi:uncharacterized protein YjbI with pentapeptide repeats